MGWKDFFKLTWGKVILFIILGVIGFFVFMGAFGGGLGMSQDFVCTKIVPILTHILATGFTLGAQIHYQIFKTDSGFFIWALLFQVVYSYLLSCILVGFYRSIKNKESVKIPLIALVVLIVIVSGIFLSSSQIQKFKSFDILTSRGFVPSLDTREKCLAKGFLWQDIGEGDGSCYNNFTKEECQSKGYYWNTCAYTETKTEQTAEGFVHNQVCVEKCIIE